MPHIYWQFYWPSWYRFGYDKYVDHFELEDTSEVYLEKYHFLFIGPLQMRWITFEKVGEKNGG